MNPNGESSPNFEIPVQPPEKGEQGQDKAVEAPAAQPEKTANQPRQAVALPTIPNDIPTVDQPVVALPPQDVSTPAPSDPHAAAHDSDHIDQVWVNQVKNIAAGTRDDPFLQKDQMSKVKAEYIQKRFNKTIKTDEAAA